jgi:hypothetical protein
MAGAAHRAKRPAARVISFFTGFSSPQRSSFWTGLNALRVISGRSLFFVESTEILEMIAKEGKFGVK